jgi:cation diffusion facilitator family transporter
VSSSNGQEAKRITIIGALVDTALGVAKVLIGLVFHSHALLVDGIHSFSDLLTDGMVLIVSHYAHDDPDDNHPYGHGRFETLGTVLLGSFLIAVAGALAYDNILRLINPSEIKVPGWPVLVVAFISIISKEAIYHYTARVGKKLGSQLLIANAWHSRSDAFSSIIVFIGAVGAMSGILWLDTVAAIGVSIFIGKIGWGFTWASLKELSETSLPKEELVKIRKTIMDIEGVDSIHNLRSRMMGDKALLDLNVEVSPDISVSEGHEISSWVAKELITNYEQIVDVTVHTDVENDMGDDFTSNKQELLPLRPEVERELEKYWSEIELMKSVKKMNLHYVDDKINVELFFLEDLILKDGHTQEEIRTQLSHGTTELEWMGKVQLWFG